MSDDESPEKPPTDDGAAEDAPAEEAPRRRKRARPAGSTSTATKPVRAAAVASGATASRWTTGHVGAALALGLALGGLGGYLITAKSGLVATAESGKPGASGQARPTAGAYVPLAAWTPREGPELAKVTIVEFSDFQ